MRDVASYATVPATAPADEVTVNVDELIVVASIVRENTACGCVRRLTPVAPSSGVVSDTLGGIDCGITSIAATSGSSAEP